MQGQAVAGVLPCLHASRKQGSAFKGCFPLPPTGVGSMEAVKPLAADPSGGLLVNARGVVAGHPGGPRDLDAPRAIRRAPTRIFGRQGFGLS